MIAAPTRSSPITKSNASGRHLLHPPVGHDVGDTQGGPADGWMELRIFAEIFADALDFRIAQRNRAERAGVDSTVYAPVLELIDATEKAARKSLLGCYRRVVPEPIRTWQVASPGIGDHTLARLLGRLGHPRIATPYHWEGSGAARILVADEPYARGVAQLWAYCGHGDPTRRPHRGMTPEESARTGSPELKSLTRLLAVGAMRQKGSGGLYRLIYDQAREQYMDRIHVEPCASCGRRGRPAQPGSPWRAGHQQGAALRKVGKEILRDLWAVSAERHPSGRNEP